MIEPEPFYFEDFSRDTSYPVLDLSVNKIMPEELSNTRLLSDISKKLQMLLTERKAHEIAMIKAVLSEIAPVLAEKCGNEIIEDFLRRRFSQLISKQNLNFYVHPDNLEMLCRLLKNLCPDDKKSRFEVHGDFDMQHSECRIVWNGGEEIYSTSQILDKIREQLKGITDND